LVINHIYNSHISKITNAFLDDGPMGDKNKDDSSSQSKAVRKEKRAFLFRKWTRVDVMRVSAVGAVHLLCLLAPFNYTWEAFRFAAMVGISTNLSITFSYHRNLTHRSFKLPKWLEYPFAYSALFALQVNIYCFHRKYHYNQYVSSIIFVFFSPRVIQ